MMIGNDTAFVLCIENDGYEVSLEKCKVYRRLTESPAIDDNLVRVIDESGEDYLYPSRFFVPIIVPRAAASAFEETTP